MRGGSGGERRHLKVSPRVEQMDVRIDGHERQSRLGRERPELLVSGPELPLDCRPLFVVSWNAVCADVEEEEVREPKSFRRRALEMFVDGGEGIDAARESRADCTGAMDACVIRRIRRHLDCLEARIAHRHEGDQVFVEVVQEPRRDRPLHVDVFTRAHGRIQEPDQEAVRA